MPITLNQKLQFLELLQEAETLGVEGVYTYHAKSDLEELSMKLWEDGFLPLPTIDALLKELEDAINEEREKQIERHTLKTLEHLSYIIECLACDFTGEAKTELGNLCNKMKSDAFFRLDDKNSVIGNLEKALDELIRQDKHGCSSTLGQISRELWNRVDLSPPDAE